MPYARVRPRPQPQPIWEINTTPLIDVMLVLLVMLIITVPLPQHSLDIDLPRPTGIVTDDHINKVVVTVDGRILWNGKKVDEGGLTALLVATKRMAKEPQLQFEAEAQAGYGESAEVIRLIKEAGVIKFAFVGNQRYRSFSRED